MKRVAAIRNVEERRERGQGFFSVFSLPCGALGQFLPLFVAESPFEIILRKTIIENVASLPF